MKRNQYYGQLYSLINYNGTMPLRIFQLLIKTRARIWSFNLWLSFTEHKITQNTLFEQNTLLENKKAPKLPMFCFKKILLSYIMENVHYLASCCWDRVSCHNMRGLIHFTRFWAILYTLLLSIICFVTIFSIVVIASDNQFLICTYIRKIWRARLTYKTFIISHRSTLFTN